MNRWTVATIAVAASIGAVTGSVVLPGAGTAASIPGPPERHSGPVRTTQDRGGGRVSVVSTAVSNAQPSPQLQVTTTSPPDTDFDRHLDAVAAVKPASKYACGETPRPCHIPVEVYEAQQPTLRQLVIEYFDPADWGWAIRAAFCESSAQPGDWYSDKVHTSSGATGWFQHMPQYWDDRSSKAGFSGFPANHPVANVGVAAWLLYSTPQGKGHWWPSEHCWEDA